MILDSDRLLALKLVKWKLWKVEIGFWRIIEITRYCGTEWLYRRMLKRQTRDDLHHAPCCEANHWHYQRLVFKPCTCGAAFYANQEKQLAEKESRENGSRKS